MAIGGALSVGLIGLKAFTVTMQAFISPGLPYFSIIGLPDTSLSDHFGVNASVLIPRPRRAALPGLRPV